VIIAKLSSEDAATLQPGALLTVTEGVRILVGDAPEGSSSTNPTTLITAAAAAGMMAALAEASAAAEAANGTAATDASNTDADAATQQPELTVDGDIESAVAEVQPSTSTATTAQPSVFAPAAAEARRDSWGSAA
jgi:hypothetical protein